ncbi:MAG TPA: hypothetical protein VLV88_04590 [Terriglobales bacterium]|nr:hypothetical protein [Terriglobales bacterium]
MKRASRICSLALLAVFSPAFLAAQQTQDAPDPPKPPAKPAQTPKADSDTKKTSDAKKPKKVWTEDDLGKLKGRVSVVGKSGSNGGSGSDWESDGDSGNEAHSGKTSLGEQLRSELARLQAQMNDTDQKIAQLKNIQSGATSGNSEMQLHHGYNMDPLPDQIKKLEDKKTQIQTQMDAIYEQARKNGIEPGQLR